ncbi:hypothetical protein SteCoe_11101 [Stentor coeruleus]|uniref:Uncharacterized protein n=1 Tax=Stentor coeruleus TaxID=5963 RepID=A0A1R2CE23_9CILI|nr:hypothetical protein SteCoe_11101 [Stentor coeruleus]
MHFGGAFWQTFKGFQMNSNSFDQLLTKEALTLAEVLDDDNVIQELRNQNIKLHEFLSREKLLELIQLITVYPPEEADHKRGHKHPFIASELFGCDSTHLYSQFFNDDDKELLTVFFQFLDNSDINPTLAGYFSKYAISLIIRKPSITVSFLHEHDYIKQIAAKVFSKSISDLAVRILTLESSESNFCYEPRAKLLSCIISNFSSSDSLLLNFSAEIICDLLSRPTDTNSWKELVTIITLNNNASILIDAATSIDPKKSCAAIRVLNTIVSSTSCDFMLRVPPKQNEDDSIVLQEFEEVTDFCKLMSNAIDLLVERLERPTKYFESTLKNTNIAILGEDRLKIVDFLHSCIKINIKVFELKIISSKAISCIVDLFFNFEMNSIYHTLAEQVFSSILKFKGENDCFLLALLESKLVNNIISNPGVKGYSGHVTKVANLLIKAQEDVRNKLKTIEGWSQFVSGYLKVRNEVELMSLGENKKIEIEGQFKEGDYLANYLRGIITPIAGKPKEEIVEIKNNKEEKVEGIEAINDKENKADEKHEEKVETEKILEIKDKENVQVVEEKKQVSLESEKDVKNSELVKNNAEETVELKDTKIEDKKEESNEETKEDEKDIFEDKKEIETEKLIDEEPKKEMELKKSEEEEIKVQVRNYDSEYWRFGP